MSNQGSQILLTADDLAATPASRRSEPRFPAARPLRLLPIHFDSDWRPVEASLVDCSTRGLGLLHDEPLQEGQQFLIRIRLDKMCLVLYRVCHCTADTNGRYLIGAELCQLIPSQGADSLGGILEALLAQDPP